MTLLLAKGDQVEYLDQTIEGQRGLRGTIWAITKRGYVVRWLHPTDSQLSWTMIETDETVRKAAGRPN